VGEGRILAVHTYPVVGRKACWRLIVDMTKGDTVVNVRATLRMKGLVISETLISQFY
jgi:glucans biosynthesis protein